jgi:catechol 2,3-dioxygenase-like lactoylglutathione lyase family enzyme
MKQAMDLHRCAPSLVPELIVSSLATSLSFWCDIVGFTVRYDRPEEGFAYIALGHAHVMLEQRSQATRDWANGDGYLARLVQTLGERPIADK